MKLKKISLFTFALFVIASIFLYKSKIPNTEELSQSQPKVQGATTDQNLLDVSQNLKDKISVTRVIDGDTIEISTGQKVRYIGIDTPETVHPDKPVQCFGKEASLKNKELVEGKVIYLEKDVSETDKYGRLLRYVYLDDEKSNQTISVNNYLVSQGYAHSSSYPPDIKYQKQFQESEADARDNNRGLWSSCSKVISSQLNAADQSDNSAGCYIKGNISSSGKKIYHLPGQKYYQKTIIDETRGEKWFCSEDEARQAGFRKSNI